MNTIQLLNQTDITSVKELLLANGLPVSDLNDAPVTFFGMKENQQLIATGALEIYGNKAILRSVAVRESMQNMGYGKQLVRFLEKKALETGISTLFLLTTTAESFFKDLNYQPFPRNACPPEILSSAEFREICPQSASCLVKKLKD